MTAAVIAPAAMSLRKLVEDIAAHAIPESRANPKTGVYKNLSAISNAIGRIQFDTGSSVIKKNRIPRVIAGRFFTSIAATATHAKTNAKPAHASQALKPATGMELKS